MQFIILNKHYNKKQYYTYFNLLVSEPVVSNVISANLFCSDKVSTAYVYNTPKFSFLMSITKKYTTCVHSKLNSYYLIQTELQKIPILD